MERRSDPVKKLKKERLRKEEKRRTKKEGLVPLKACFLAFMRVDADAFD